MILTLDGLGVLTDQPNLVSPAFVVAATILLWGANRLRGAATRYLGDAAGANPLCLLL